MTAMLRPNSSNICACVSHTVSSSAQTAQYRRRLIDAGIIGEKRRGVVAFELPYFRAYLEHRL